MKHDKDNCPYQEKAEICEGEQCDGVLKWSTRFRESQKENKQLKEELNTMTRSELQMANRWADLKQKLEKIKEWYNKNNELSFLDDLKLKEMLDGDEKE